jgi:poly-gamma-glutamate synthesis protein (capsule biosynthesis protein)
MNNRKKKVILVLISVTGLIAISLFFVSKKTISSELRNLITKSKQAATAEMTVASKSENSIKILLVGDMMFDRYVRQVSDRNGYGFIFQKVDGLLKGNDLVVGNLEGPITDSKSVSVDSKMGDKNNYIFTFDPKVSDVLAKENIRLVNIGNNHISNFASSGIESTKKYLTQSGVDFFGNPENMDKRMAIENVKNIKIAFVNYNQFVAGAEQKTIADINSAKEMKVDLIIVYTHWGKEFIANPDENIKNLAHEFIDDGADLIVGSHPHVVQPKEEYRGKMIYYSLGNFIFDQYFDLNTQKGLIVQVTMDLSSKKIVTRDLPIILDSNGQTLQD